MLIKPDFFDGFTCLAGGCHDTCCAGWEIDVDEETAALYSAMPGENGERLRRILSGCRNADGTLSLCREGERCPFLQNDGLCRLIIDAGEEALCDICREHPRFYEWGGGVCEAGLGLCCEEAAELWLSHDVRFLCEDDGETPSEADRVMLAEQSAAVEAVLSSPKLGEALASLLEADGKPDASDEADAAAYYRDLTAFVGGLEALDPHFPERFAAFPEPTDDRRFRRLAAAFLYRWRFESTRTEWLRFAAAGVLLVRAMGGRPESAAKDFSKEIEYDPDNQTALAGWLASRPVGALAALCRGIFL